MAVGRRERPTPWTKAMTDQQWYWVTYAGDALQARSPARPAIGLGYDPDAENLCVVSGGRGDPVPGSDIALRPLLSGYCR
jgi:hypothetical protein